MRVQTATQKIINPAQLKSELGHDVFTSEGLVQAEGCTLSELEAAVASHVADAAFGWPPEDVNLRSAYTTLRQWAIDAQTNFDQWPTKTAGQKDVAIRETVRRLGVICDRFADFIKHAGIS